MLSIRVTSSPAPQDTATRDRLRQELADARTQLQSKAELLRQRQAQLNATNNRVFVVPETDRSAKRPVLVVVSAADGTWSRAGDAAQNSFRGEAQFKSLLRTWDPARDRLVFYVRPSGIRQFLSFKRLAEQANFGSDLGYDAAEEGKHYDLLPQ